MDQQSLTIEQIIQKYKIAKHRRLEIITQIESLIKKNPNDFLKLLFELIKIDAEINDLKIMYLYRQINIPQVNLGETKF